MRYELALRWPSRFLLLSFVAFSCGTSRLEPSDSQSLSGEDPVDGIVFVHGFVGSGADWDTLVARFEADGWPTERLIARSYKDPSWGCNTDNASQLALWVQELKDKGAKHIAVIAHSMGGLSSRYYLERQGGADSVAVFITLGTMHHGLLSSCLSPLPVCVWQELCLWGPFINDLNKQPATPGPTKWVSIFSTADAVVSPASARLDGAHNIELEGLAHDGPNGLQKSELVYQRVKDSL